jgi:hypothetical protein
MDIVPHNPTTGMHPATPHWGQDNPAAPDGLLLFGADELATLRALAVDGDQ